MRNLERELEELEDWAPAWKPKPGDTLVGTLLRYDTGHTPFGPVRTATIRKADGERVSVWLSNTVLLNEFARLKPKPGERIGLKYLGTHRERRYHRFRLLVDRPDGEPSFEPLGGETGRPLEVTDADVPF
jgi:hypothetical protein